MTRKRIYLIALGLLWTAVAVLLAAGAVGICREGLAARAGGDLFRWIYTREGAAARFAPVAPLCFIAAGMTAAGWILGVRDERTDAPAQVPDRRGAAKPFRRAALVRGAVLALAVGLVAAGALNGGMRDALKKAIAICTECVGLG